MRVTIKSVQYRRKREGMTDYRKRLKYLSSGVPRLVIRRSLRYYIAQLVVYAPKGDKTVAVANSGELKKFGWTNGSGNMPSAYLTGLLLAKRAVAAKHSEGIVDLGLNISIGGSCFYAVVKGAIDGGMKIPCGEEALPSKERLEGSHIANYASMLKSKSEAEYKKRYSAIIKSGADPAKISEQFQKAKETILKNSGLKVQKNEKQQ